MNEQQQTEVDPVAESEAKDVAAFETAHRKLKEFVNAYADIFSALRKLADQYTETRTALAERVKTKSKRTLQEEIMGPLSTKLTRLKVVNFDALEEIVEEEEFRNVCEITYSFRGEKGALGKAALELLREKYGDKLKGLDSWATPKVEVKGPKDIDIKELGVML